MKLKGSWALIRTKGGDGRSWLLIKHRDEWAGPIDIATFAPLSVKSGGDFTDIVAQESPDLWTSNRAAKGGPGAHAEGRGEGGGDRGGEQEGLRRPGR